MSIMRMVRLVRSVTLLTVLSLAALSAVPASAAGDAAAAQPGKRIAQLVTIRPKPGMEATLANRLLALAGPTRHEGGNLRYDLFQKDDGAWMVFEYWADDAARQAHFTAPYSAAFLKDMSQFVEGAPEVVTFQSVDVAR